MSFEDCLVSGMNQGAITRQEAEELLKRFDEIRSQHSLNLDDVSARIKAKEDLLAELKADRIELRRRQILQSKIFDNLEKDLFSYVDHKGQPDILAAAMKKLEHFGFAGYSSVEGRAKVLLGQVHSELAKILETFERDVLTGKRKEMPKMQRVVAELHGEVTNDATASEFAQAIQNMQEVLRQRFNNAGGAIGKLDSYALPQLHNQRSLLKAGKEAWKEAIFPLLDTEKMKDPMTGLTLTPKKLYETLDVIYNRITTDGWIDRKPSTVTNGRGILPSQRSEHRFLHFKDATSWQKYADMFGDGDAFAVLTNHFRGMTADIAAMEILGPNPQASINYMKQLVKAEKAKAISGEKSTFKVTTYGKAADKALAAFDAVDADYALDTLWCLVRGGEQVNKKWAIGFGSLRNLLTSAQLGSAILTAIPTDPFMAKYAKKLCGLPVKNMISEAISGFTSGSREEAVMAGLIMDDAIHVVGQEARYVGSLAGERGTRWLADRTISLSGLSAWTQGRKHAFGIAWQQHTASELSLGKRWEDLDKNFRVAMEGFGISATDWSIMAKAEHYKVPGGTSILRPHEIALLDPAVSEKYHEAILGMTERAVPSGTKTSRALVTGGQRAGTIPGEIINGIMQYKAFGLSVFMLQKEALLQQIGMNGTASGASYAGGLLLGLTAMGALGMQFRNIANGKDPQPMDDWRFWASAAKTGGGLGIFGDFLFAEYGRFGNSITADIMGPQAGFLEQSAKLAAKAVRKGWKKASGEDDEENITSDLIRFGRRYTPVVSSHWLTRTAWQRIAMDQLEYYANPDAYQTFRRQAQNLKRDYEQDYFWKPGEVIPSRMPDPANLARVPFTK